MQKSWGWPSLFYDFGEVSINHFMIFIVAKCNGCVPSCSLKLYFSVTALSEAWSLHQTFCMLCGLMFTWLLKNKRTTIFFFFFFLVSHSSFLFITATCCLFVNAAVSCLLLKCRYCHMISHFCSISSRPLPVVFSCLFHLQDTQWVDK